MKRAIAVVVSAVAVFSNLWAQEEKVVDNKKVDLAKTQLAQLCKKCEEFKTKYGRYPDWLKDLIQKPQYVKDNKWTPLLENDAILKDPWGNKYKYSLVVKQIKGKDGGKEIEEVEIISAGPDGIFETNDDIVFPEEQMEHQLPKCTVNLKNYYQALMVYYVDFKDYPSGEWGYGSNLWLALGSSTENYLCVTHFQASGIADGTDPIYQCPLAGKHRKHCDYRGPKEDWGIPLAEGRIYLACDKPDNHPDGSINALRGDGGVTVLQKGTEEYEKALADTCE